MKQPKTILITGASSGIGEALALHYAAPGIMLAITGRDEARLKEVQVRLEEKGAHVHAALLDVMDKEAMSKWISDIDNAHPLDLVIANAGIGGGSGGFAYGEPVSQARQIFDVNGIGVFNTIEPVQDKMAKRGCGQIAIVSSLAGFRGWPGAPAYSASKCAVRAYGEALRGSMKHTGVCVNVICPGFVVSRMTDVNRFKMPLLMETDKAAQIIVRGLSQNKGRICFPLPTHFLSWVIGCLPDSLAQFILSFTPKKSAH